MLITKQFLESHFPEHSIKAIVGHDDERSENEKTGLHTHYFLDGLNRKTGEYDLRKRQLLVVNEYLIKQGLKDELLPLDEGLTRQQSRAFGHYWQRLVQDYMNDKLLNPKGLHAEFSDETEKKTEQYQYMIRQGKLPKSQRDFNHQSRVLENLKLEIQVLREERIGSSHQLDTITQQVDELSESLDVRAAELEQIESQKRQYQQELQEAAHRYIYLEEHSEKKEAELAYTESLLAEKEAQVFDIDAKAKQQMKDIVLDAFMFMQAKRRKFPKAEREYAEKIAQRLGGEIAEQLVPLLDAAFIESGYYQSSDESFEYK